MRKKLASLSGLVSQMWHFEWRWWAWMLQVSSWLEHPEIRVEWSWNNDHHSPATMNKQINTVQQPMAHEQPRSWWVLLKSFCPGQAFIHLGNTMKYLHPVIADVFLTKRLFGTCSRIARVGTKGWDDLMGPFQRGHSFDKSTLSGTWRQSVYEWHKFHAGQQSLQPPCDP